MRFSRRGRRADGQAGGKGRRERVFAEARHRAADGLSGPRPRFALRRQRRRAGAQSVGFSFRSTGLGNRQHRAAARTFGLLAGRFVGGPQASRDTQGSETRWAWLANPSPVEVSWVRPERAAWRQNITVAPAVPESIRRMGGTP